MDPSTRLGHVHYTTANLDRQISFYESILGFKLHWKDGQTAGLGAGKEDLLRLTQVNGARPAQRKTGLYHTAFLIPNRWELAQLLKRIAETRTPIQGMTNHGTHWAIYLPDAEGNGIELAWDFPEDVWPRTFEEMMQQHRGLYPDEVFQHLGDRDTQWTGADEATRVGHVHLHVSTIPPTQQFYHQVMGFDIPFVFTGGQAMFFSAGGYHHHIGTNIWQGEGAAPPPPNSIGLRYYTVVMPNQAALEQVEQHLTHAGIPLEQTESGLLAHDPSRNGIMLTV